MQLAPSIKAFAREIKAGLCAFWRTFRGLLETSRLADALGYALAIPFALMPIVILGQVLNWALARQFVWFGIAVVGIAAAALVLSAAVIANEQFLRGIRHQGIQWPSLLAVALAWFAVVVFGGLSCGFERLGIVAIQPSVAFTEGCATRYADMYLWHLFDSIPGIKFNDTVGWVQNYVYTDKLSGWLMVAFKVLVIFAVIGSFVACGRLRRETPAMTAGPDQRAGTEAKAAE